MIDSHCHLDHEPLLENLTDVVNRAKEIGITKLLTICTTLDSFKRIKTIVETDKMIYGTYGIHPHETENNTVNKNTIIKAVKENNEKETGITIHYVSEAYDKGTFIFQNKVALTTTDTICDIEAKVSALEQECFPKVINSLLNNI